MTLVDALYESFCDSLPGDIRDAARALPFRLRLAPAPGIGFGNVFRHEVTLEAPRLVAEALPACPTPLVEQASLAHLLAVVEAFGVDRIEDGQIAPDRALREVLDHVNGARNAALAALGGAVAVARGRSADAMTEKAIRTERELLSHGRIVPLAQYLDISERKQAVGIAPSEVLCAAAGASSETALAVGQCLLGIALGLQLVDDAMDWEDDAALGGAWAALLAPDVPVGPEPLALARQRVHRAGTLGQLVGLASDRALRSARTARALGATRLSEWAEGQAEEWAALLSAENRGPGYVVRKKKLAAWAGEVLT